MIQLTHTLIKYSRRKDSASYRWAVLGVALGHGNQGAVYEVIATLYISGKSLIVKNKHTRIAKLMTPTILNLNTHMRRNAADHEFMMMNRLPDIYRPHSPIHDTHYQLDVLIAQRFEKFTLAHLLTQTTIIKDMTLHAKLDFCKLALLALKKLHDAGIAHRDLKPENMMVEINSENIITAVKIIDLGFAKEITLDTSTGDQPGSLPYAAPELLQNGVNQPADIFAMGRIFWMIFCDSRPINLFLNDKDLTSYTTKGLMPVKQALFYNSSLSIEVQTTLYDLFMKMSIVNPENRISITSCLAQLDTLYKPTTTLTHIAGTVSSDGLFKSQPITIPAPDLDGEKSKEKVSALTMRGMAV